MRHYSKYLLILIILLMTLSTAAVAYAAPGDGDLGRSGRPPHGHGHGLSGEVIAVHDDGLTLVTSNEDTIVVNITDDTVIHFVLTQADGNLEDITVGDNVQVKGRPTEEGVVDAKVIVVEPDGDKIGGRVTAVEDNTILVENRDGTAAILVDDDTEIRIGEESGNLDDVVEGMAIVAFGERQDDGSLAANLILVKDRSDMGQGGPPVGRGDGPPPPPSEGQTPGF